MKILLLIFCLLSFLTIEAMELHDIALRGFDKKILHEKDLRFSNSEGTKVHIQVNKWEEKNKFTKSNFKSEIQKMFLKRKEIYEVFGFKNVELIDSELIESSNQLATVLEARYEKINGQKASFIEKNFYKKDRLLQIKIIMENNKKLKETLAQLEKELVLDKMDF